MKFPDLSGTSNMSSEKSHISNNRLYTHNPSNSSWTYDIESLIPKHHWKFSDDSSNDYANDSGNSPIKLNKQGSATLGNIGKINKSTYCPSDDNFMKSDTIPSETFSEITQCMWVKKNDNNYITAGIYFNFSGTNVQFRIEGDIFRVYWGGTWVISTSVNLPIGEWLFIVFTYDLEVAKFYLNGILVKEETHTKTQLSSTEYSIGSYNSGKYSIRSYFEDFRIYDRVLNGQEISAIYNMGQGTLQQSIPRGFPTAIPPRNHIKCQDTYSSFLNDSGSEASENTYGNGTMATVYGYKGYISTTTSTKLNMGFVLTSGIKTLSFWVKPNTTNGYILQTGTNGYNIQWISTTQVKITAGSNYSTEYYNLTLTTGKWTHIVLCSDNVFSNITKVYVDSEYITTISDDPSSSYLIWNFYDSSKGYVRDIRHYRYMLSYTEIKNIYNNGCGTLL